MFTQSVAPDAITLMTFCFAATLAISHFSELSKYFYISMPLFIAEGQNPESCQNPGLKSQFTNLIH